MKRSNIAEEVVRPIILAIPVEQWHSGDMVTFITKESWGISPNTSCWAQADAAGAFASPGLAPEMDMAAFICRLPLRRWMSRCN